jgi:hypothetical protein
MLPPTDDDADGKSNDGKSDGKSNDNKSDGDAHGEPDGIPDDIAHGRAER